MSSLIPTARWILVSNAISKARSSHCVSVTQDGLLLLYGGELLPRTPVDAESPISPDRSTASVGSVHTLDLKSAFRARKESSSALTEWSILHPKITASSSPTSKLPEPRVGATTVWDQTTQKLYLWGGRGGVDPAPLPQEQSGLWEGHIDEGGISWERLQAKNESDGPEPRSYHSAISSGGNIYVHAGCPPTGRLSTLHAFNLASKLWTPLASAPAPGRGGTALAVIQNLNGTEGSFILRFGGFAGHQLPVDNAIDIYSIASNAWRTVVPNPDPSHGRPGSRSVHGFIPFSSTSPALKDAVALVYHGERDASSLGHAGAGEFWDDAWVLTFSVRGSGAEEDASGGFSWKKLAVAEGAGEQPEGRGWFPSAQYVESDGETKAVLFGGLLSSTERSGEAWVLEVS